MSTEELQCVLKTEVYPLFKSVEELVKQWPNDPEDHPYDSLYKAREVLESLHATAKSACNGREEEELWGTLLASIAFQLGRNYADCSEPASAEVQFEAVIDRLKPFSLHPQCIVLLMQASNHMGVIWAERRENEKALVYLLQSKAYYDNYKALSDAPPPWHETRYLKEARPDEGGKEGDSTSVEECWKHFEMVHTYTLYFLAQVYGNKGESDTSALYCHATLCRQLDSKEFDGIDWSLNSAALSQYFITNDRFAQGRHCLCSAERVLADWEKGREEELSSDSWREKVDQTRADLSRCWIKYSINALNESLEKVKKKKEGNEGKSEASGDGGCRPCGAGESNVEAEAVERFQGLDVSDLEERVPAMLATTFEEARAYFLFAQQCVGSAKAFFALDSHASDYAVIVQDHSSLFRLLAQFELDPERKCRMHKRRADMLSDLTNQLNPQHFLVICRQCQYELGEIYYEMADLKIVLATEKDSPPPQAVAKINRLLRSSMAQFQQFLDSFSTATSAIDIPEEYLRSCVMAQMWIARTHTRFIVTSTEVEATNVRASLAVYQWVLSLAEKNPAANENCSKELDICKEMVQLLPGKLAKLK